MTKTVTLKLHAKLSKGNFRDGNLTTSETFTVEVPLEIPDGWETVLLAEVGKIDTRVLTLGIPLHHGPTSSDSGGI
jgi:hypothetical protein